MEYGPEIEVNGKRPEWLADDDMCMPCWSSSSRYKPGLSRVYCVSGWPDVTHIRLPADHWAYSVIEQGYWPWAGGDKAPDDWDGGDALCRDGSQTSIIRWFHKNGHPYDIIGYKRKVEPSIILTHIEAQELAEDAAELDALREKCAALEAQWADAIAKYPDLEPNPDHALKDEILVFLEGQGYAVYDKNWEKVDYLTGLLYAWAKRHPAPASRPCTLTPEELAEWRLKEARRAASIVWDDNELAKDVLAGAYDACISVQSALAVLKKYNITPETVK